MSATAYDIGDVVHLTCTFTNQYGSPALPATVVARVLNGSASPVGTYVYGSGTLVAAGSGIFTLDQPISATQGWGHWHGRFEGYGPDAAEEFTFYVRDSAFY